MNNSELENIPYTTVEAALTSNQQVIAILPIGATEAHGPHLPLNVDVLISKHVALQAATLLNKHSSLQSFVLPALAYTPADYAAHFSGTISLSWKTLELTLIDIAMQLQRQGFDCLALANSHFDPGNVNTLRHASSLIEEKGLPLVFADATRRKVAAMLTEEFQSGDCHAGAFESSLMLSIAPELVNREVMRSLPPIKAGLVAAIMAKEEKTFKELGMQQAYCGSPAQATVEEGNRSLEVLSQVLYQAILEKLEDSAQDKQETRPL